MVAGAETKPRRLCFVITTTGKSGVLRTNPALIKVPQVSVPVSHTGYTIKVALKGHIAGPEQIRILFLYSPRFHPNFYLDRLIVSLFKGELFKGELFKGEKSHLAQIGRLDHKYSAWTISVLSSSCLDDHPPPNPPPNKTFPIIYRVGSSAWIKWSHS
jgi:hypothetical protein